MSLYNGFTNHEQEQKYYTLIRYLVLVLEKRLMRFYQGQPCNEKKFVSILSKLRSRISKLENNKYSQPKFADSLASFLREVRLEQNYHKQGKLGSFQSQSMISYNDNKSQLSLDFSFDRLPSTTKVYSLSKENSFYPHLRNKYRSFETMKTTPVIPQRQQLQITERNRISRGRQNELSHLRLNVQPPKLNSYLQKIKKQTRLLESMSKKNRKQSPGQVGKAYLGQRRKKNKKSLRAYQVQ